MKIDRPFFKNMDKQLNDLYNNLKQDYKKQIYTYNQPENNLSILNSLGFNSIFLSPL